VADLVEDRIHFARDDIQGVLPYIDYLVPSLLEARKLTGLNDCDACADAILGYGIPNVVIKLGSKGSMARTATRRELCPICSAKVVDTLGSGDSFVAGFVSACSATRTSMIAFGSARHGLGLYRISRCHHRRSQL
jgi:2-dehydro-3-deoxygluconokinase